MAQERARGQADVPRQDDSRDTVLWQGCGGDGGDSVHDDAPGLDVDARPVAPDVEDAISLAALLPLFSRGRVIDSHAGQRGVGVDVPGGQVTEPGSQRDCSAGYGVNGLGQAFLSRRGQDDGVCDTRVRDASPSHVPIELQQRRIGQSPHDGVGWVRGIGQLRDDRECVVAQSQAFQPPACRLRRVRCFDFCARQVVIPMVVVVGNAAGKGLVTVRGIVEAAGRPLQGQGESQGFRHGFDEDGSGDRVQLDDRGRVHAHDRWWGPVRGGQFEELIVSERRVAGMVTPCEEFPAGARERLRGACVLHERGRGRVRHRRAFRDKTFTVTLKPGEVGAAQHADARAISGAATPL